MQHGPAMPGVHPEVDARDASVRTRPFPSAARRAHTSAAETIVEYVRDLLERGALRPGDRLPPERALAVETGVSRSSVRVGLRALATMGIIQSRHGSGTYIADGPPVLESDSLHFLAALHGFTRDEMFEARRLIEVSVAGMAAVRATGEQIAAIAEEVTSMFASLDDAQAFLRHDIRFHQAVAAACGNPILTSLVEMLSQVYYERRRETVDRARNFRERAEMHRRIYMAIRQRDANAARDAMAAHLTASDEEQAMEEVTVDG
ncbi:GntR family transcriptional regulator [Luteitalea sp. TBR-22]|uniref:FadR/GntR family transcriptional regulator n=1 Tax=Luteitalea sp. TBR-22 TaxID=2802971 RepID=UPI001AF7D3D6|nr:FadR/GntR family transcriptional regulator [Luteitalea sp. TBR-22]BCS34299.1 GntR family transcriptional regulator [Luteitalea sp. TBR-22]